MKKFDEEGIQKLVDTIKGDIGGFADRLRATLELSKDYQTFSGLSDGMEGDVKFIYKTAAVE